MDNEKGSSGAYVELLQFLKQKSSYSHNPDELQHVQTHISHVFIVPPYVFKIKKHVNLGFLDYSSLKKRKKYCYREVELNCRLCKGTYLGVVAIYNAGDTFRIGSVGDAPDGTIVDFAVKMKKLPEQYFLHKYIEDNILTSQHLDRVIETLADFYLGQDSSEEVLKWGIIENIRINTDENFQQVKPFVSTIIDEPAFNAIEQFTNQCFDRRADLFNQRIDEKRIVDGHGDLHLEHIHLSPQDVCIYDCIEFNERFRYGDVASDLAYLAMDLDFNDQPKAEHYFVDQMAEKMKDPQLHEILNFYKCYRAFVKGKVKSLQSNDKEVSEKERQYASETASKYFNLSLKYALIGSRPKVLIFIGGIGTGKSTLAKKLHETLNISWFSSDLIRKKMAGVPLTERTPKAKRDLVYTNTMSERTYNKLRDKTRKQLIGKKSTILDATFNNVNKRAPIIHLLNARDTDYLFIETQASEETVKERLKARDHQDEVLSDARIEDYPWLSDNYEPPREIPADHVIQINTDQPIKKTLNQLYSEMVKRNI